MAGFLQIVTLLRQIEVLMAQGVRRGRSFLDIGR